MIPAPGSLALFKPTDLVSALLCTPPAKLQICSSSSSQVPSGMMTNGRTPEITNPSSSIVTPSTSLPPKNKFCSEAGAENDSIGCSAQRVTVNCAIFEGTCKIKGGGEIRLTGFMRVPVNDNC